MGSLSYSLRKLLRSKNKNEINNILRSLLKTGLFVFFVAVTFLTAALQIMRWNRDASIQNLTWIPWTSCVCSLATYTRCLLCHSVCVSYYFPGGIKIPQSFTTGWLHWHEPHDEGHWTDPVPLCRPTSVAREKSLEHHGLRHVSSPAVARWQIGAMPAQIDRRLLPRRFSVLKALRSGLGISLRATSWLTARGIPICVSVHLSRLTWHIIQF